MRTLTWINEFSFGLDPHLTGIAKVLRVQIPAAPVAMRAVDPDQ